MIHISNDQPHQTERNRILQVAGMPDEQFTNIQGSSQDSHLNKVAVLSHCQRILSQVSRDADKIVILDHPEANLEHRLRECLTGVFPNATPEASSKDLSRALEYLCQPTDEARRGPIWSEPIEQSNQRSLVRRVILAIDHIQNQLQNSFRECGIARTGCAENGQLLEARRSEAADILRRDLVSPLILTLIHSGELSGEEAVPVGIRLKANDTVGRAYATFAGLAHLAGELGNDFEDLARRTSQVAEYRSFLSKRFEELQPKVAELVAGYIETISSDHLKKAFALDEFRPIASHYHSGQDVADFILKLSSFRGIDRTTSHSIENLVFGTDTGFPQPSFVNADFDGVRMCIQAWRLVSEFKGLLPALLEIRERHQEAPDDNLFLRSFPNKFWLT